MYWIALGPTKATSCLPELPQEDFNFPRDWTVIETPPAAVMDGFYAYSPIPPFVYLSHAQKNK